MLAEKVHCQGMHSLGVVLVLEHHGAAYGDCVVHSHMVYPLIPPS
jgi:hypothetical protein